MFAIITVRQLPPIESFKSLVSFEFLYGMYLDPSARALMQLPILQRIEIRFKKIR